MLITLQNDANGMLNANGSILVGCVNVCFVM